MPTAGESSSQPGEAPRTQPYVSGLQHGGLGKAVKRASVQPGCANDALVAIRHQQGEVWVEIKPAAVFDLDASDLASIEQAISQIEQILPRPQLVIDLNAVTYLCSALLEFLACANRLARQKGGRLTIAHVPAMIRDEIHLLGMDHAFDIRD